MLNFYASLTHDRLNGRIFNPCSITNQIMVNPLYPTFNFNAQAKVIVDSGAFQEICARIKPVDALRRQLVYRHNIRQKKGTSWNFEALCIYDQMGGVDEQVINNKKIKMRGTIETAEKAIIQTLQAAKTYALNRNIIDAPIMFIGQGINPIQYANCVKQMLEYMTSDDWFGFGGFCIIGRQPSLKPLFYATLELVLPLLKSINITRIHLLGVCVTDAVTKAVAIAKHFQMVISNDGSAPEQNGAIFGRKFENGKWQQCFSPRQKFVDYHPCELALENIKAYYDWGQNL